MDSQPPSFLRRLGIWLTTMAIAVGVGAVVAEAPAMAAGCYASSCNGYDPSGMGCDVGAYTLEDFIPPASGEALVELRYSPSCHAGWSRYTTGAPGYPRYKYLRLQIWTASTGGTYKYFSFYIDGTAASGERNWTPMWTFGSWLQACVKNSAGEGPCTARH